VRSSHPHLETPRWQSSLARAVPVAHTPAEACRTPSQGREPKKFRGVANVRLGANYGLKSDIARCPSSAPNPGGERLWRMQV